MKLRDVVGFLMPERNEQRYQNNNYDHFCIKLFINVPLIIQTKAKAVYDTCRFGIRPAICDTKRQLLQNTIYKEHSLKIIRIKSDTVVFKDQKQVIPLNNSAFRVSVKLVKKRVHIGRIIHHSTNLKIIELSC